jgi:hypothetical protein
MKRLLILATVAVLAIGAIGTVSANDDQNQRRDIKATLGGFAEVPAISTTGKGKLRLSIDQANSRITYELSYSGLEGLLPGGVPSAAHIHLGQPGVAGSVIAFLCGGDGKPACPASTTTPITGTITPVNILGPAGQGIAAGEFAEAIRAIRAGMVYANVHTAGYPTGEIRGQLQGGKSGD